MNSSELQSIKIFARRANYHLGVFTARFAREPEDAEKYVVATDADRWTQMKGGSSKLQVAS
jgi:hypothetical protein